MRLWLAIKAFKEAWNNPEKAQRFIEEPIGIAQKDNLSHLRLLALLQQQGRLIDFFKEDISTFSDSQVGAAVRKIHQDCGKILEELVAIRPILDEAEGSAISLSSGYNPVEIKVVGQVKDGLPLNGRVVHRGWKASKRSLPKKSGEQGNEWICPAEIEVR